jgi:hypothetical protein
MSCSPHRSRQCRATPRSGSPTGPGRASTGSSDLCLIDPRGGVGAAGFTDDVGNGDDRRVFMRLTPVEGLAVFMPGYLMHWVEPNKGEETRIAIGLNFRRTRDA